MINTYDIYLISDSTGETLERIFLAIKAQFKNFKYKTHFYSFTRTENQISKILEAIKDSNILFLSIIPLLIPFLIRLYSPDTWYAKTGIL